MEAPCQKIVWDVLPAIRAAIAVGLVQCGVSQTNAAKILEIAPPAVSQYIPKKRGYRIVFEDEVKRSIELLAQDLKNGKEGTLVQRTCEICRQLRTGDENRISSPSEECCGT